MDHKCGHAWVKSRMGLQIWEWDCKYGNGTADRGVRLHIHCVGNGCRCGNGTADMEIGEADMGMGYIWGWG